MQSHSNDAGLMDAALKRSLKWHFQLHPRHVHVSQMSTSAWQTIDGQKVGKWIKGVTVGFLLLVAVIIWPSYGEWATLFEMMFAIDGVASQRVTMAWLGLLGVVVAYLLISPPVRQIGQNASAARVETTVYCPPELIDEMRRLLRSIQLVAQDAPELVERLHTIGIQLIVVGDSDFVARRYQELHHQMETLSRDIRREITTRPRQTTA